MGVEKGLQIELAVHDKRCHGLLLTAPDRDPIADGNKRLAENTMYLARSGVHSSEGSQVNVDSRSICMPRARLTCNT
jgi:hypothetical protein